MITLDFLNRLYGVKVNYEMIRRYAQFLNRLHGVKVELKIW